MREQLKLQAEALTCKDAMTIDECIEKRAELRSKMAQAKCDNLDDPKTTVRHALKGLFKHPGYTAFVTPLLMRPPGAIAEALIGLKTAQGLITQASASAAQSQASQNAMRQMQRGMRRLQSTSSSSRSAPRSQRAPTGSCAPACIPNGSPLGLSKPRHHGLPTRSANDCQAKARAQASHATDAAVDQNQQGNAPASDNRAYLLNSAAHPSHDSIPAPGVKQARPSCRAIAADGRSAPITHIGGKTMQHAGPTPLKIDKVIVAPTFPQPLLSAHQISQRKKKPLKSGAKRAIRA